jgi:hypothetical protein
MTKAGQTFSFRTSDFGVNSIVVFIMVRTFRMTIVSDITKS